MKVVYFSGLPFTDSDFPLIREYQRKGIDVYYFLPISFDILSGAIVSIKNFIPKCGIFPAEVYHEFDIFKNYLNFKNVYVLNRTRRGFHPLTILLYIKFLLFILKIKPDIIHITNPLRGASLILYLLCRKMVLTVHDPFPHSGEASTMREFLRKIAFKLIPKIILLNGVQKDKFVEQYKLSSKKILINKLGIYDCMKVFVKDELKHQKKFVLFFGRISPYKGLDYLCEAMKKVHTMLPDIDCFILGGGKMYFDISPYNQLPYIHIINRYIPTDELAQYISSSLFTICPYTDATQSGVVISSFAFAKPVLATNVGAIGETVIDNQTGKLVPPRDVDALAHGIIDMIQQPELLVKMEENIKKSYWEGNNSWSYIADKNINFYIS